MACRASTIIFIINISMAGTVYDVDGNAYQTVQIGEQIWMAENLKTTHYKNGDAIQTGYDGIAWDGLTTGAYAVYNDDESNAAIYGYLYNWYAVDDSREVCPDGWHVPTDDEYKELEIYLGMSELEANSLDWLFRGTNEDLEPGPVSRSACLTWFLEPCVEPFAKEKIVFLGCLVPRKFPKTR